MLYSLFVLIVYGLPSALLIIIIQSLLKKKRKLNTKKFAIVSFTLLTFFLFVIITSDLINRSHYKTVTIRSEFEVSLFVFEEDSFLEAPYYINGSLTNTETNKKHNFEFSTFDGCSIEFLVPELNHNHLIISDNKHDGLIYYSSKEHKLFEPDPYSKLEFIVALDNNINFTK